MRNFSKDAVENTLFNLGCVLLEESDGHSVYVSNIDPGAEFTLDWSMGTVNIIELQNILKGELTAAWETILESLNSSCG